MTPAFPIILQAEEHTGISWAAIPRILQGRVKLATGKGRRLGEYKVGRDASGLLSQYPIRWKDSSYDQDCSSHTVRVYHRPRKLYDIRDFAREVLISVSAPSTLRSVA